MRRIAIGIIGALFASLLVTSATTASAAAAEPGSMRCQDPYVHFHTRVIKGVHRAFPDLPWFKDGPGGTITARVSRTDTVESEFGVATSVEANGIFVSAKVEISAKFRKSKSTTVGHDYEHKISRGKYGHLKYGSWSKRIGWKKVWHKSDCTRQVLKRGKATLLTKSLGWKYWETRH